MISKSGFSTPQRTGSRSRTTSDSIDTLNELASFLPKEYLNLGKRESIPKSEEHLHKTSTLAKPYLDNILPASNTLNVPFESYRRTNSLRSSIKKFASRQTKKMVRFADSLGLDLEQTRKVHSSDSQVTQIFVPYNPTSSSKPRFAPLFLLSSVMKLNNLLEKSQVCLESVAVGGYLVKGVVKVQNLTFEKRIAIRYTVDDWKTFSDTDASYIRFASDGFTDKFSFTIDLTNKSECKLKTLEFAIRYIALNVGEFWDSNNGVNYRFRYEDPNKILETQPSWYDDAWLHFN